MIENVLDNINNNPDANHWQDNLNRQDEKTQLKTVETACRFQLYGQKNIDIRFKFCTANNLLAILIHAESVLQITHMLVWPTIF